jgi:hypothetical protein
MTAKRKKMNKADEAYIMANLDKNSLEISEEIGLDQLVVAELLKSARADRAREPARLKVDGKNVGVTLTEAMIMATENLPKKGSNDGLNAPHIFRRQNKKKD